MKYFQETTEWSTRYVPNHIYYLTDDKRKMVGYIKTGSTELIKFSKPMNFDSKGRKFTVLPRKAESDSVYFPSVQEAKPAGQVIEIEGSSGKKYYVSKIGNRITCTCPGFAFRHKCKHVEQVQ